MHRENVRKGVREERRRGKVNVKQERENKRNKM